MTPNQRHNTTLLRKASFSIAAVALLLSWANFSYAIVPYQEPKTEGFGGYPYPKYDANVIPELLNGTTAAQQKTGSFLIGGTGLGSSLCLNPAISIYPGITDTIAGSSLIPNCISSWNQLKAALITANGYLRLLTSPTRVDDGTANDTLDNGAIAIQAIGNKDSSGVVSTTTGQLISLIAEAPDGSNSSATPTAIVSDSPTTSLYAATFAGKIAVVGDVAGPGRVGNTQQICLNLATGTAATSCIADWGDISKIADPTIVRLQNMRTSARRDPDNGSTAVSGYLIAGSLVAGMPNATTSSGFSCGDGMCSYLTESASSCPTDCQ